MSKELIEKTMGADHRPVSIIIPCRNEEKTIRLLLDALVQQSLPLDQYELIISDGMSTDRTREIIRDFAKVHSDLEINLIDNPERSIPSALNRAVAASKGKYIIRLDAHSVPASDYIERCVSVLESKHVANVGGVWDIRPGDDSKIARSIAVAVADPLAAGDARYRTGGEAGEVDTVPFGAFSRDWMNKVGEFNLSLHSNEDYEFNTRLRRAGGIVWFDPRIRSTYFSRTGLKSLIDQYYRYGYWKARMLRGFPGSLRWRQALPPLFVLSTLSLILASFFNSFTRLVLGVQWSAYFSLLFIVALSHAVRSRDSSMIIGVFLAILCIHIAWGMGFLVSIMELILGRSTNAS